MTEGLSRRDLVAVIGAGMAVSACTDRGGNDMANGAADRGPLKPDTCGNEGQNPHQAPDGEIVYDPPNFTTDHIAILCIELGENWAMAVNHANFDLANNEKNPPSREKKAIAALNDSWIDQTKSRKRFRDNGNIKPRNRKNGDIDDHSDFSKFRFNKPIELFVYIYQDKIGKIKSVLPDKRLLSFGPYMEKTDGNGFPLEATKNCSYFEAHPIDLSNQKKLNDHGFLFKVENWSRGLNGKPISGPTEVLHSMNIHFSIPVKRADGSEMRMPMVFDPDTGNGTGNEP